MEKKIEVHQSVMINKVMSEAQPQTMPRPERREFKKRPEVKINTPFAGLAGFKVNK